MNKLVFNSDRRFGVELEVLAFDGKNRPEPGNKPLGMDYIALIVSRGSGEGVDCRDWEHTQGNDVWVVKPDSSCGLEICTPIMKGCNGIKKVCEVVYALSNDERIKIDNRCSVHVHIEIADFSYQQIASVIAYWFKCEPIFMDSVPSSRKRNRYCQFMGLMDLVEHDTKINPEDLVATVGSVKYYSLNTNQFIRNNRKTIEFRIAEGSACKDPFFVKNWLRLLIHFVEMASKRPLPEPYNQEKNDPWMSFLWLDLKDVLHLLGFDDNNDLSPGLTETRNWFLARLQKYMSNEGVRSYAYNDLQNLLKEYKSRGIEINEKLLSPDNMKETLFNESTRF